MSSVELGGVCIAPDTPGQAEEWQIREQPWEPALVPHTGTVDIIALEQALQGTLPCGLPEITGRPFDKGWLSS